MVARTRFQGRRSVGYCFVGTEERRRTRRKTFRSCLTVSALMVAVAVYGNTQSVDRPFGSERSKQGAGWIGDASQSDDADSGPGTVVAHQKINHIEGDFTGDLDINDEFGSSVALLGDLDGDGVQDVAVGSPLDDDGEGGNLGAVWILFLNEDGTVRAHQKISRTEGGFTGGLHINNQFGSSLASVGDLDGDGVTELAVGAHYDDDGGEQRGAVWILFLRSDGTVRSHRKISDMQGNFSGFLDDFARFGRSVAALGDLDEDGVRDLAVGAEDTRGGAVWVLFLNADGTVEEHQKIASNEGGFQGDVVGGDRFSYSIVSLGDLDGDGVIDLAVGAEGADDGVNTPHPEHGVAWILFLLTDGTVKAHQKISDSEGNFTGQFDRADSFGSAVAAVGDLDRDGVLDLVVGAMRDDDGGIQSDRGAAWVLFLDPDGTVKSHKKISDTQGNFTGGLERSDRFGRSACSLGDLDRDGVTDLAIGANKSDLLRGAVWILSLDGFAEIDLVTDFVAPLVNGQVVESIARRVSVAGVGPDTFGTATFDSTPGGPNAGGPDPDLLVGQGNILILQENPTQSVPDVYDVPDDAQLGGTMVFDFLAPATLLSVDLIDVCPGSPLQDVTLTLFDQTSNVRTYSAPGGWTTDLAFDGPPGVGTLDLTTLEPQPGFLTTATASETIGFDSNGVVRLEVFFSSSGALDNLLYDPHPDL